jgi:outer membrane protein
MSMRLFASAVLAGAALVTCVAAPVGAQGGTKIGFIRSQQLLEQTPGRAEAEAAFSKEVEGYRGMLEKMGDTLQKMIADYRKAEPTLTPAVKDAREKALRTRQEEMQAKQTQLEQQARQRQIELMAPVTDMVKKAIEDVRTEEGYTIIFDIETQGNPVVAIDKNLDVTDRVAAKLRLMPKPIPGAPSAAPTTPAKPTTGPVNAPAGVTRPKPPTQ